MESFNKISELNDKLLETKLTALETKINSKIERIDEKLDRILEQTTKTNGRVTRLEKKTSEMDESYMTYKFLMGHKKWLLWAFIVFAYAFTIQEFRDMVLKLIIIG